MVAPFIGMGPAIPPPAPAEPMPPPIDPGGGMGPMQPVPPDPMMGGAPPMGPPAPPPPFNPFQDLLDMLRMVAEQEGTDAASDLLHLLPPHILDDFRESIDHDPELVAFYDELLPDGPGPLYPPWFTKPRKPSQTEIEELSWNDHMEWEEIRDRMREDLRLINLERVAVPDDFDRDHEKAYLSTALSDEVRGITAMLGSIDPSYEIPYPTLDLQDDTQMAENALYAWDEAAKERHANAGHGHYQFDVVNYLLSTGYVCAQLMFDPLNPDNPFPEALHNPATVVPTWDEHGLLRVTRRYTDTVAKVISDYDPNGSFNAQSKLLSAAKKQSEDGREQYRLTDPVTVIAYYDRWYWAVYADDVEVVPVTAHRYGFVPFIVVGSGVGEPTAITQLVSNETPSVRGLTSTRARLKYKHQSWPGFRKQSHAQKEMIMGVLYTLFDTVREPPMILEQDEFAEATGDPEVHREKGGITKIKRNHEALTALIENPQALALFNPLMNAVIQDEATNALPREFWGIAQSANESGNAIEGKIESGSDKIAAYISALETFYAQRAAMRLRIYRDWGQTLQTEDGEQNESGSLTIPYQRSSLRGSSRPPSFTLTPEVVRRTGVRVKATLTHVRLQNLAPLGNAVAMWLQMNAMSLYEAMKLRGVRDPDAVMREIRFEKALMDENVAQAMTLDELRKVAPNVAAFYEQIVNGSGQGGPGGPQGPPGFGGENYSGPNTSAMNLQPLGMGQAGPTGRPSGLEGVGPPMGPPLP